MLRMKNTVLLSVVVFLAGIISFARALPQDTGRLFQDDPIASMLDSLMQLKFFEPSAKPYSAKTAKYNFAADSIPYYDDPAYEQRMAKLDAQSPFDLMYNMQVRQYIDMYAYKKRNIVSKMLDRKSVV